MAQVYIYPGRGKIALTSVVADFKKRELLVKIEGNPKTCAKSSGFLHGLSRYLESLGLNVLGPKEGDEISWSDNALQGDTLVFDVSQAFLMSWYSKIRRYDLLEVQRMVASFYGLIKAKSRLLATAK